MNFQNLKVCQFLIYQNGDTPLHVALNSGADEVVEVLIQSGARQDLRNHHGETAIDKAGSLDLARITE